VPLTVPCDVVPWVDLGVGQLNYTGTASTPVEAGTKVYCIVEFQNRAGGCSYGVSDGVTIGACDRVSRDVAVVCGADVCG
jgi:hypothetical protein